MRLKPLLTHCLRLCTFVAVSFGCRFASGHSPADLVLKGGIVYTVDQRRSVAEAVALKEGKIIYVGTDSGTARFIDGTTRVMYLGGRMVLPGFIDSHCHPLSAYMTYYELRLNGFRTVSEYRQAIRDFAATHPDAKYIRGRGWSNTLFKKTGPDRRFLDELFPAIPVSLSSEDGHSKWVNSRTLELAGITRTTPDPEGGVIERDPATGEPTGTLRETAADLVAKIMPPYSVDELARGLEAYQSMALAFGITTAHDASIDIPGNEIPAYRTLEKENRLRMRFRVSLGVDPVLGSGQVNSLVEERARNTGSLFKTNAAKIFLDGVVEGSTAYLKESYKHLRGNRGKLLCNQDSLNAVCAELQRNGLQIHIHAIGDAATSAALDAFTFAEQASGRRDARHLITHLQLVDPVDIPRFKQLGVVAVTQPYWFMKDEYYYRLQVPYLGQVRADAEYPMESFFRAGVVVASSSDYPVTIPCNPLVGIQTGVTRLRPGTTDPREVLWPEERASLEEMIASFTINGAYANFLDTLTGSIEIGKSADLIVLDRNLFAIPPGEIQLARVLLTLFEGKEAFRDSSFNR
jgi:predicted amidohydrolase YtcJ